VPKETTASSSVCKDGSDVVVEVHQVAVHWGEHDVQISVGGIYQDTSKDRTEYSYPMSRKEINDTIRALRKARDRVYGADA
jgi:hypothetical protein